MGKEVSLSTPSDVRTLRLHRALDETRRLLVDHIERSISELQTALTNVAAARSPLDGQLAEVALAELVGSGVEPKVDAACVMAATAEYFDLTVDELRGRRGVKHIAQARQIAMYLCRELTDLSLPGIGRVFDRDHTTVMHAVRKIREEVAVGGNASSGVSGLTVLIQRRAARGALRSDPERRRVA